MPLTLPPLGEGFYFTQIEIISFLDLIEKMIVYFRDQIAFKEFTFKFKWLFQKYGKL
jgi:hypothetical protein